jgi:hypothetical protein
MAEKNVVKTCVISKADFIAAAKPLEITINGVPMLAEVKEFSTGSFGFFINGKMNVKIGEKSVPVQIGANFTVVNSKEAK